jgi:predicted flap endonuclease-1-like 5' DNA nuclease
MTKKRPIGVMILAILAAIGAIIAVVHTLQMLHLFPISGPFGKFTFFTFDLFGAILWGILALIYIWVVRMLWNLEPQGWLFVSALSALNLILAVISVLGQSSWQAMLPAIVVNGLILIYSQLSGTKEAFGMGAGMLEEAPPAAKAEASVAPISEMETEDGKASTSEMEAEAGEAPTPEMEAEAGEAPTPEMEAEAGEAPTPEMEAEVEAPDPAMVTGAAALTHDLSYVEGIGEVYGGKLKEAGVDTPQALLERGATPKGRKELAEATGISEHLILKWVDEVDLYRINGLGTQYSELLEAAGVSTILELAQRNPEHLYQKVIEVNEEHHHVRHVPSQSQVEDWVNQAKELPRVVSY